MSQVITLYHTNSKEKCNDFLSNSKLIIADENGGPWLGKGMYFWDNLSNSHYWAKEKIRKEKLSECTILSVVVEYNLENLLDLTDLEVTNRIYDLWFLYCERNHNSTRKDLGVILNILFRTLSELSEKYHIIKAIGNNYNVNSNLLNNNYSKRIGISINAKTIYNVRVSHIIKSKSQKEVYYG